MMEGSVHRGRWNRKGLCTILLLCMPIPSLALLKPLEELKCELGEYDADNGICCNKCPPGFKLVEKCHGVNQRSNCQPCPNGQYTDRMNYTPNCRRCRSCKNSNHEVEVSKCEAHQNTICRCEDGYYKHDIDSGLYECLKCRVCGPGEQEKQRCTSETNAVCECRENYYKVNSKCQSCKNCTTECEHHCPSRPPLDTKSPDSGNEHFANIIVGIAAVALVSLLAVVVITYLVTKRSTKKKLLKSSLQTAEVSPDLCEEVLIHSEETSINISVKAALPISIREHEQPFGLPDCVPFEIKIPDLIYTVLEMVPVVQVKQLVRCLGVKDREIEQAEHDHRSCSEAHYQMLRGWAERGSRAGGMLHWPLLQELLEELKKMHLGQAAEELETKYGIQ